MRTDTDRQFARLSARIDYCMDRIGYLNGMCAGMAAVIRELGKNVAVIEQEKASTPPMAVRGGKVIPLGKR
jgi:hypothetical protein